MFQSLGCQNPTCPKVLYQVFAIGMLEMATVLAYKSLYNQHRVMQMVLSPESETLAWCRTTSITAPLPSPDQSRLACLKAMGMHKSGDSDNRQMHLAVWPFGWNLSPPHRCQTLRLWPHGRWPRLRRVTTDSTSVQLCGKLWKASRSS